MFYIETIKTFLFYLYFEKSSFFLSSVLTNPSGHSWWYFLHFTVDFCLIFTVTGLKTSREIFGFSFHFRSYFLWTRDNGCIKKGVDRVLENVKFG